MSKYLVTITDNMGNVYDEYVITNPEALSDMIKQCGVIPAGDMKG